MSERGPSWRGSFQQSYTHRCVVSNRPRLLVCCPFARIHVFLLLFLLVLLWLMVSLFLMVLFCLLLVVLVVGMVLLKVLLLPW